MKHLQLNVRLLDWHSIPSYFLPLARAAALLAANVASAFFALSFAGRDLDTALLPLVPVATKTRLCRSSQHVV